MLLKFWTLFFLLTPFWAVPFQAEGANLPIIQIDSTAQSQQLQMKMRLYLDDPQGTLTPQQVWQRLDQFIHPLDLSDYIPQISLGMDFWLAFELENSTEDIQHRTLALTQQIFLAELSCSNTQGKTLHQRSGPWVSPSERPYLYERVAFKLTVLPQERLRCLIRFKPLIPQLMEVVLAQPADFAKRLQEDLLLYGLFFGAAALMAVYHFLIYFTLKEKSLLLYSGMVASMTLAALFRDGQHNHFLAAEAVSVELSITGTAMVCLWLFLLLRYYQSLTDPVSLFPRLYWPLRWWGYAILVITAGFLIDPVTFGYPLNLMIVLTFLGLLPITLWQFKRGQQVAGWFAVTVVFGLGGVALDVLRTHALIPSNTWTRFGPFGLIFLEFILLAWVMSRRFNLRLVGLVEAKTQDLEEKNELLELRSTALNERTEQLQSSIQVKDTFFSIIAHDLRGPIGSILVIFRLVREGTLKLDSQMIEHMFSNLSNIGHLLEDLLAWALNQQGRLEVCPTAFYALEPVREGLELLSPMAEQKQIELVVKVPEDLQVLADRTMVATVLRNLLNNALKFTHSGGQVTVEAFEKASSIRFEVKDTGVGLAPERVSTLFGKNCATTGIKGTQGEPGNGLGLLLVREFIGANGGEVGAESQEGVGSSFWFTLPQASCTNLPSQPIQELPVNLKHFLVVEDNPLHQAATESVLRDLGVFYDIAPDGKKALELARNQDYEVVLMDIDLPLLSGVESSKRIQQLEKKTHILALTGYSKAETEEKFGTTAFEAFLKKPLGRDELLVQLARLAD